MERAPIVVGTLVTKPPQPGEIGYGGGAAGHSAMYESHDIRTALNPANVDLKLIGPKYQDFVDSNLKLVCREREHGSNIEKMFSWIFDLRDRECKESKDAWENPLLSSFLIYSQVVDNRILKLRKQLSELQIKMVSAALKV
jgi:hypothetical protein